MNKNLLIVTSNFPPSTSIGTQRILKLCKYLNDDWHIHVLTQKAKYLSGDTFDDNTIKNIRKKNLLVFRTSKMDLYSFAIRLKETIFDNSIKNHNFLSGKKSVSFKKPPVFSLRKDYNQLLAFLQKF